MNELVQVVLALLHAHSPEQSHVLIKQQPPWVGNEAHAELPKPAVPRMTP